MVNAEVEGVVCVVLVVEEAAAARARASRASLILLRSPIEGPENQGTCSPYRRHSNDDLGREPGGMRDESNSERAEQQMTCSTLFLTSSLWHAAGCWHSKVIFYQSYREPARREQPTEQSRERENPPSTLLSSDAGGGLLVHCCESKYQQSFCLGPLFQ